MYRLFMTGLLLVVNKSAELRILWCVYISIFQLVIVTYLRPYINRSHNVVAAVGQFIATLTIIFVLNTIANFAAKPLGGFYFAQIWSLLWLFSFSSYTSGRMPWLMR